MMIPLSFSVVLAAMLFVIGLAGLLVRRNILVMIMCIELMVNAANLNLVAFSHYHGLLSGRALVLFVIAIEAAELAVALGIVAAYYGLRRNVDMDGADTLRD